MTIPNNPIVNSGLLYINGLQISDTTDSSTLTKKLFLMPGMARNSTNIADITLSSTITMDGEQVGANGTDANPLIASTFYAVYVIGDSTGYKPTGGIFSLSPNAPAIPAGYDMFRRIGWILTDSSANILPFWQYGNAQDRTYYYDNGINALVGGVSTTFVPVNLSPSVPPISTEVLFQVAYTASVATHIAKFITFGSGSPSSLISTFGYGVAAIQNGMLTVPAQLQSAGVNPSILYKVEAGDALTLITSGYKDYL